MSEINSIEDDLGERIKGFFKNIKLTWSKDQYRKWKGIFKDLHYLISNDEISGGEKYFQDFIKLTWKYEKENNK